MSSSDNGDQEIYGGYSVDDEDQPGNIDDLGDPDVADELDRGYSPPEKYSAGQGYGNTPWEEEHREGIDQRIAQEEPDVDPYAAAFDSGSASDEDEDELTRRGYDREPRAGRLVADDDRGDVDAVAADVGIDGGAASAEEAAVHVVDDPNGAGDGPLR